MLGFAQIRAGAGSLALWWLKQWQQALPEALRGASQRHQSLRVVVRCEDTNVAISLVGRDQEPIFEKRIPTDEYCRSTLDRCFRRATLYARRNDVALSLCCEDAIVQSLVIPQQARRRAEEIVHDHIMRKTPLKLSSLFIGYEVRAAGAGKLELRYLVFPKTALETRLARLSLALTDLTAVEAPTVGNAPPLVVPFSQERYRHGAMARRLALALTVLCIASAAVGFNGLVWRQDAHINEIDARASAIAARAQDAGERLKAVYGLAEDITRLAELREGASVVQVWEELARVLPASTYVTEVEIRGRDVQIVGFSSGAPELLHVLAKSPILHGAALSGPVIFDAGKGKEHFQLRASLRKARLASERD
jgi:general secretion pathway protein L